MISTATVNHFVFWAPPAIRHMIREAEARTPNTARVERALVAEKGLNRLFDVSRLCW